MDHIDEREWCRGPEVTPLSNGVGLSKREAGMLGNNIEK